MALSTINFVLLLVFIGTSLGDQCSTFTTKAKFKIRKFTGQWYEVSRLQNILKLDTKCDNSTYTLNSNGTVTVFKQGVNAQGRYESIRGLASVLDSNVTASFRVFFETGKIAFYSVLATDHKRYAAVYACHNLSGIGTKLEFGYILSRKKTLKAKKLRKAMKAFANTGVDVNKFIPTSQDC